MTSSVGNEAEKDGDSIPQENVDMTSQKEVDAIPHKDVDGTSPEDIDGTPHLDVENGGGIPNASADGDGKGVPGEDPEKVMVETVEDETPEKKEDPMVPLSKLFSFADKYDYLLMALGTIGAGAHGAALPLFLLFFGKILNSIGTSFATDTAANDTSKFALDFVYLGIACLGSAWLEVSCWMQTGERQTAKIRSEYLKALLRQDVSFFDTETTTGDFVNSIASDPLLIQEAISEKMGNFIHFIGTFFAGFAVGFSNQWRIALVTIAIVPLIAAAGGVMTWALTSSTSQASSSYSEAGGIAEQAISQVRTVYSFVSESKFVQKYSFALESTLKFGARAGLAKGVGLGSTYAVLFCCWALLLWYGGVLVRKGTVNGGKALSTIFSVIVGSLSLGQAMPNLTAFAKGRVAGYKIFKLIDHEPTINKIDKSAKTLDSVEGRIELRNVDFNYPARPDVPIFKNFSLEIPAGKTVAIVGTSGSGKSTVVSLIERFYDPIAGEVLLDGHDLKTLNLKWLRAQMGLVNQEPALFATTIAANILYGKETATQEEIEAAAKAANAHSFISQLPLSYQTQVGERGVQLSGGQKQRVAIARAMLKNPKVLLLDEATSALDAGSEQVVQDALDRLMVGRTTVIVAHRLSTIRNADTIAVVQEGQIVEMGTHSSLSRDEGGAYAALVRLQEMASSVGATSSMKRSSSRRSTDAARLSRVGSGSRSAHGSLSLLGMKGESARSVDSEKSDQGQAPSAEYTKKGSWGRLLAMSKVDWIYFVAGTIGSILAGAVNPSFALIIASVLQQYYGTDVSESKKKISEFSLIFVGIGIVMPFVHTLQHYSLGIVGERLVKRVRERMLGGILRNELGWFDRDENNSSQILARLSSDATTVRGAIGDRMSVLLQNSSLLVVAVIASLVLSWRIALVMMATFPVLVLAAYGENWFLKGFSGDIAKAHARASQVAGEAVANIRTVAAFNAEDKVEDLFAEELHGPSKQSFFRGQIAGFGFGISEFFMYSSYALGLWYAGKLVNSRKSSFGAVIKVFLILVVSAFGVAETLTLAPDLVRGGQAVEAVFEVLDRETSIEPEDPKAEIVEKIRGEVELRQVVFAYPSRPDVIVFKNLNLKVRSGQSLALVGASGSGKSSVISLIERFYDPMSGQVLIDGKNIKKYNLKSLRQHIGLVLQEPALFAATISENILYGKDGASEAEIIEAAKAANAHNFISSLPNGYKTEVGERGIQLSGGQKQRVAIARAVLKDPAILLLDEATSALDSESERIVQDALDRLMKRRTTVVVAHRLSTIRGAGTIAVVEDGNILEEGTHSELLSRNGAYARLINLQDRSSAN